MKTNHQRGFVDRQDQAPRYRMFSQKLTLSAVVAGPGGCTSFNGNRQMSRMRRGMKRRINSSIRKDSKRAIEEQLNGDLAS